MAEGTADKPFSFVTEALGPDDMRPKPPPQILHMPVILLLLAEEPSHGYALFKSMCELGVFEDGSDASAIYPALRTLKDDDLVFTELVDEGSGPARKVYHITPKGRIVLAGMSEHMKRMSSAFEYFQERYSKVGPLLRASRPEGRSGRQDGKRK
jgi:PadR family transcriptional regulator, regulatory protein PadR